MKLSTLDWCRNVACKTAEEAIEKLYSGTRSIILYHSNSGTLDKEISKVYSEIKKRNSQIKDINHQMLPTYPYMWDDIDGCLHVKCAEISMDTFEVNAECIAVFTGYNRGVLTNPNERRSLNPKAMASLATIGSIVT